MKKTTKRIIGVIFLLLISPSLGVILSLILKNDILRGFYMGFLIDAIVLVAISGIFFINWCFDDDKDEEEKPSNHVDIVVKGVEKNCFYCLYYNVCTYGNVKIPCINYSEYKPINIDDKYKAEFRRHEKDK